MPASVRIDQSRLQRLLSAVGGPGDRLLRRKAERVAALAREYSAGHGSIPQGIVVGPVIDKSIRVTSTNPHTLFIVNGTRPHLIRPRRARALRFVIDGQVVFAKVVRHPGTRPDDFMSRALRAAG